MLTLIGKRTGTEYQVITGKRGAVVKVSGVEVSKIDRVDGGKEGLKNLQSYINRLDGVKVPHLFDADPMPELF